MNILARVFSFVFHPLLMATYLLGLLSFFLPAALYPVNVQSNVTFLLSIFVMTFVLPALNILFLKILGTVSSFTMEKREERIRPFFLITLIYCFVTYILAVKSRISTDDNVFKILLIIDLLIITGTMITFFYKVSIHSLGIFGVIGVVLPLNKVAENNTLFIPTMVLFIVAGIVMSARLQLNSHTPREVLVGALTGFGVSFLSMNLLF